MFGSYKKSSIEIKDLTNFFYITFKEKLYKTKKMLLTGKDYYDSISNRRLLQKSKRYLAL